MTESAQQSTKKIAVEPAGFMRRLMAWIYDLLGAAAVFILALVVGQLILYLSTFWWIDDFSAFTVQVSKNPLWALYHIVAIQYYYVWCWVKGGQTVGMRAWRMKLIHADGSYLTWREGFIRATLSLGGIAHIWSLFNKEKRGWHDIATDSYMVVFPKGYRFGEQDKPLL